MSNGNRLMLPRIDKHDMSDLVVQLVGICVAEQQGTATDAQRGAMAEIKTEMNRRFDLIRKAIGYK